jgi:hypothetical protein
VGVTSLLIWTEVTSPFCIIRASSMKAGISFCGIEVAMFRVAEFASFG